jgi:alkylation response protein AidB-like acyl-CoA dehydrogenase
LTQGSPQDSEQEYRAVRAEVRGWLAENWSGELTLRQWWQRLGDSGWGYPGWPAEWFGKGLDRAAAAAADQELTDAGVIAPPASGGQRLAGPTILEHGTGEQKARLLPPLIRGEEAWCQLFSEPDAGSDLASVRTRMTHDGSRWIVNGQKIWTSGAQVSDRAFLLARTGTLEQRHRGLTYCIVDLGQPGVTVRPLKQMTGECAFNQVFLDDVVVQERDIIGAVDGGWPVALTTLGMERFASRSGSREGYHWSLSPFGVPGRHSPSMGQPVSTLIEQARASVAPRTDTDEVVQTLVAIAAESGQLERPEVRDALASVFILHRLSQYARVAAAAPPQPGATGTSGSVRKLLRSQMTAAARDTAITLGARAGLRGTAQSGWARSLEAVILSSPAASIAGGTDEIQHNIIGERILGLPREPRTP